MARYNTYVAGKCDLCGGRYGDGTDRPEFPLRAEVQTPNGTTVERWLCSLCAHAVWRAEQEGPPRLGSAAQVVRPVRK